MVIDWPEKSVLKTNILVQLGRGRSASKTGRHLAALAGCDPSSSSDHFRSLILELIDGGYPIASSNSKPKGYFMAVAPEEVKEYSKSLRDRAKMIFIRRRGFLRASRVILEPTQMAMSL